MNCFKLLSVLLVVCALGFALVAPTSPADITGDGAAHRVATSGTASWVLFITPSGNSASVRIGDSNVSSTRGAPVAAGGGLFYPPITPDANVTPRNHNRYDLSAIYCFAATGDKVSVSWGQ